MVDARRAFGIQGEALARDFLLAKGHKLLESNFRTKRGEIDLVTQDGQTIVFVEVRARRREMHGHPLETIGWGKQRRLWKLAERFLVERFGSVSLPCRFDVIGIIAAVDGEPEIIHVENAFSGF